MSGTVSGGVDETSSASHHGPESERGGALLDVACSSAVADLLRRLGVLDSQKPASREGIAYGAGTVRGRFLARSPRMLVTRAMARVPRMRATGSHLDSRRRRDVVPALVVTRSVVAGMRSELRPAERDVMSLAAHVTTS